MLQIAMDATSGSFVALSQVAGSAESLSVIRDCRAAVREGDNVIGMEVFAEGGTAFHAAPSRNPGQYRTLPLGKSTLHLLTQYSVSMTSRTGRLGGGCSTACLLIRAMAAA